MARSLFNDINMSSCLVCRRASISLGRRKGSSKAWAKWEACPLLESLIVAS